MIAALQQTNQFGGFGDPMMGPSSTQPPSTLTSQNGLLPPGALPQQPPAASAQDVAGSILQFMMQSIGKAKELDFDVLANGINTLATAYKSLTEQPAGANPEIEMAKAQQEMQIEQQKAAMELQIMQQEAAIKQAQMQQDMRLKQSEHANKLRLANEQAELDASLKARQQQHQEAKDAAALSSQHEIGMTKAQQQPKASTSTSK